MKSLGPAMSLLLALATVAGCLPSGGTTHRSFVGDEQIPRPERIIVYDFAATPADIPADAAVAGHYEERATPQTAREIELGRRLGDRVAAQLVSDIGTMGLSAERAGGASPPQPGDLVIRGEFVAIDEGNRAKRMLIGFGAGAANLKTFVEVYQVTATGLRPLGSGEVEAAGAIMPGLLLPVSFGAATSNLAAAAAVGGGVAVGTEVFLPSSIDRAGEQTADEISKVLGEAFKRRGWIA